MRYFIVSGIATSGSETGYFDTHFESESYPTRASIKSDIKSAGAENCFITNIIELSKADYESYTGREDE